MRTIARALTLFLAVSSGPASLAQPGQPADARPEAERFEGFIRELTGNFRTPPVSAGPDLVMRAAAVRLSGLPNAMWIEIARADSPVEPFRQFVLRPYLRQGQPRVRTFELVCPSALKEAIANLSAAPEAFDPSVADSLVPTLDMPLEISTPEGKSAFYVARTEHPFPTNRLGAIEMTASLEGHGKAWRIADAGFDANGNRVWGVPENQAIAFAPIGKPLDVRREAEGLVIITTIAPASDATRLRAASEGGGEVAIHFTYWTSTGQRIDTSRKPGREPPKLRVPGGTPFPALDTALAGIAKGERRKIVVPAALAYGANGRGTVPPNTALIYDIECLGVDNSAAPVSPAPRTSPHSSSPPSGAPPAPSRGDEPIGSPPTNGTPETPR